MAIIRVETCRQKGRRILSRAKLVKTALTKWDDIPFKASGAAVELSGEGRWGGPHPRRHHPSSPRDRERALSCWPPPQNQTAGPKPTVQLGPHSATASPTNHHLRSRVLITIPHHSTDQASSIT